MKKVILLVTVLLSLNPLSARVLGVSDPMLKKTDVNLEASAETASKETSEAKVKEEKTTSKLTKPTLKCYGFVRNVFYYDSRQNIQSSMGLFNQIPKDESWNETHDEDLNAIGQANFQAFSSRIGLIVSGVKVGNASLSAKMETDFCGFSQSTTMLRIRQAFLNLNWEKHALLAGQTWHPMSGDLPEVLGLSTGSPFEPFNRSPQLRYVNTVKNWNITVAALWQFQYLSVGPDGKSANYLTKGILPEFFLGIDYNNKKGFTIGAGVDLLRLRPRSTMEMPYDQYVTLYDTLETGAVQEIGVDTIASKTTRIVKEYAFSASPILFIKYQKKSFKLVWKCLFGENTSHFNMMSGYGVVDENEDGTREYAPVRNLTTFANLSIGKKFRWNLFGGYFKNLGMSKELKGDLYVNGPSNIDYMWRISPAVTYNLNGFGVGLEYELTGVGYGDGHDEYAKVEALRDIKNHRLCAIIKYSW